eukprot:GDKI01008238.1.p1 GENE.GDKI01008238.1~~GDKI01008238.1.p1  ORF type:complete len:164 (-),score=66.63 GDKI01008238.1:202-657(-)
MKFFSTALAVLAAVAVFTPAAAEKDDLAPNDKVRVGVKFRPTRCTLKSKKGDKLSMHYTGTLRKDGSKFDSSLDRGTPFEFTLGAGMVIKGWDNGLADMCIGEKRKLTIPSGSGYGDRGFPPTIPGGATLVFDVELVAINGVKQDPAGEEL